MAKNRNMGGSGARDSTQQRYVTNLASLRPLVVTPGVMSAEDLLTYFSDENKIECLECGRFYKILTVHVANSHRMGRDEYCIKHGIPVGTALACKATVDMMSAKAKARIEAEDDEAKAARARGLAVGKLQQKAMVGKQMEVECPECHVMHLKSFIGNTNMRGAIYCDACLQARNRKSKLKYYYKHGEVACVCGECGGDFIAVGKNAKSAKDGITVYCSNSCKSKAFVIPVVESKAKKFTQVCKTCSQSFTSYKKPRSYCCHKCCWENEDTLASLRERGKRGALVRKNSARRDDLGVFVK